MSAIANEKPADAILVIDALARKYADSRTQLAAAVTDFEAAVEELRRQHLPHIRKLAAKAADAQAVLAAQIEPRQELFVQPRTMTLHGIKVGFQKGKGRIVWDDADKVVERIRAQFARAQADGLLDISTTPSKDALLGLPVATLKKLGCTIEGTGDLIVIKAADGEVDKLVAKILKEGSLPEQSA